MKVRATLIGFSAILMWSFLALFTTASGTMPPFQLSAICFAIGSLPGIATFVVRPERLKLLKQPVKVWVIGIAGLFGYHFLYFTALRNAPAVEAGLIAYLWPLLIVFGSALLPGERLRWYHMAGAIAGLCGTVLIIGKNGLSFDPAYAMGYGAALLCALTWSSYSLVTRRFDAVSTDVVTGFCLATALLSLLCHLWLETSVWPDSASQWLAVAGLGLLPVGAAFYAWDYGVKNGDIQILGAASYAAPLLSTLVLLVFGFGEANLRILGACVLITGGAVLAASGMFRRKTAIEDAA
ncbi:MULTISPECIES: DMT family transporter [Rhizobium/Agrobacterium group]|uniref:Premeases of the drub/metabolic transporter protein n=2 Tax=Rhizobium/Agrobacterium group TaxID=227290 RepID=B9JTL1_ALLAM|nr:MULTISPECIES: EamA family transporter [Rhizobium/Agrobacterium group]ACM37919.1 Premeases of the drub/metabolic transporter protein [Allorhizobium ampelinum S4]MCF1446713.1 EamA family transporter [Allorhizobium ampelinum]MUO29017.1 EamA family transporter [Agrobacterium vitis]MUO43383.1 EamA family transporter [Agrobacterium vitis]MUP09987.1 EamA family transporter [Agrobacterium vitis]